MSKAPPPRPSPPLTFKIPPHRGHAGTTNSPRYAPGSTSASPSALNRASGSPLTLAVFAPAVPPGVFATPAGIPSKSGECLAIHRALIRERFSW